MTPREREVDHHCNFRGALRDEVPRERGRERERELERAAEREVERARGISDRRENETSYRHRKLKCVRPLERNKRRDVSSRSETKKIKNVNLCA